MSQVLLRAPLSMCVMLCLALSASSQPEQNALPQKPQNIELIAADLTTAELGHVQQKQPLPVQFEQLSKVAYKHKSVLP